MQREAPGCRVRSQCTRVSSPGSEALCELPEGCLWAKHPESVLIPEYSLNRKLLTVCPKANGIRGLPSQRLVTNLIKMGLHFWKEIHVLRPLAWALMTIYNSQHTEGLFKVNIVSVLIFRDTCWSGPISEFLPGILKLAGVPDDWRFPLQFGAGP